MDAIANRLSKCFQTVFPELSESAVSEASQDSVPKWDSTAAIMLVNVVEDEFGIQMDFDRIAELDSFRRIHEYLTKELQVS